MPNAYKTLCRQEAGRRVEIWFQDEARFGQQGTLTRVWAERGTRPRAWRQTDYEWVYLFGSVCPATGAVHGCLLPWVSCEVMDLYLSDFARHLGRRVHALLVLDGAGWHTSGRVKVPGNVTLVRLPPKAPELNPAELPWREMRQKYLGNRIFRTLEELDDAVAEAWLNVTRERKAVRSLCGFDWIPNTGQT